MVTSKVAKRYSQGLLDFCKEFGRTDVVYNEMHDIANIAAESRELNNFFQAPYIDYKRKLAVADEVFKSFSQVTKNLIKLVIKKGREEQLFNIAKHFIHQVDKENGVQRIILTTATQLSSDIVESILNSSNIVDSQAKKDLKVIIRPEILGGYILRVGDQQIDASVKTKLNQIKKEFILN